jgi:hypothetical protein
MYDKPRVRTSTYSAQTSNDELQSGHGGRSFEIKRKGVVNAIELGTVRQDEVTLIRVTGSCGAEFRGTAGSGSRRGRNASFSVS